MRGRDLFKESFCIILLLVGSGMGTRIRSSGAIGIRLSFVGVVVVVVSVACLVVVVAGEEIIFIF